jgi:hypothetical protein
VQRAALKRTLRSDDDRDAEAEWLAKGWNPIHLFSRMSVDSKAACHGGGRPLARAGVSAWVMHRAQQLGAIVETTPTGFQRLGGATLNLATTNRTAYGASWARQMIETESRKWQGGTREHELTKTAADAMVQDCVRVLQHNENIQPITETFIPGGFQISPARYATHNREDVKVSLQTIDRNWEEWSRPATYVHERLDEAIYQRWKAGTKTYVEKSSIILTNPMITSSSPLTLSHTSCESLSCIFFTLIAPEGCIASIASLVALHSLRRDSCAPRPLPSPKPARAVATRLLRLLVALSCLPWPLLRVAINTGHKGHCPFTVLQPWGLNSELSLF